MNEAQRLSRAYAQLDAANAEDPNRVEVNGVSEPKELVFARRLNEWVLRLRPDASEALLLASRCQHICRWQVPRSSEPAGRAGYLKWRSGLKRFHAEKSAAILNELGYDEALIVRVQDLNLKKNLRTDPECQTIEDALCLVFLEYQFDALIESTEEGKMVRIVEKTWAKMSPDGRKQAMELEYSKAAHDLLKRCALD